VLRGRPYVIAAYSAKSLADALVARGCIVVIPANPTHRHLVENLFQRIKRFRRIAMRFEKLARNFLAFLFLASSLVWATLKVRPYGLRGR